MGSRHILSVILHGGLIATYCCHVVGFVVLSIIVEQSFLGVTVHGHGTSACGSVVVCGMRGRVTYQEMAVLSIIGSYCQCTMRGFSKHC